MLGDGTLARGLPGLELSDPASVLRESSWLGMSSSRTQRWHTLCWQGNTSGCVKSSLQMGQISSRSKLFIGTCRENTASAGPDGTTQARSIVHFKTRTNGVLKTHHFNSLKVVQLRIQNRTRGLTSSELRLDIVHGTRSGSNFASDAQIEIKSNNAASRVSVGGATGRHYSNPAAKLFSRGGVCDITLHYT